MRAGGVAWLISELRETCYERRATRDVLRETCYERRATRDVLRETCYERRATRDVLRDVDSIYLDLYKIQNVQTLC